MKASQSALPLSVSLLGLSGVAMLVPAIHAVAVDDFRVARAFFYSGLLTLILFSFIATATWGTKLRKPARSNLLALFGTFTVLPLVLAVPFVNAVPDTSFMNATLEMLSSVTTTGATLYDWERLPPSVHLWRGLAAWLGGFVIWVSALAVLAPLNLGGFEIGARRQGGAETFGPITRVADSAERMTTYASRLWPIYTGLTGTLWLTLFISGDPPTVALIHAMSTLSTSGISPVGGVAGSPSGYVGEFLIFLFFVFAVSRVTFGPEDKIFGVAALRSDPELRVGLLIIVVLPTLIFIRHFLAANEFQAPQNFMAAMTALWGGFFTVASFLTTTGFESAAWEQARNWSGLSSPSLLLMGLALFGGGVATTAGGVKLLRIYVLYSHGLREMEKLVHPNSIGGEKVGFRRQAAFVAWIFFMLFALSIALTTVGFAATGLDFEQALVLTLACLTTTGPLIESGITDPIVLAALEPAAKAISAAAMVVGRLETLAIIALLNPSFWRS